MSISRFGAASAEPWEPAGPSTLVSGLSIPWPDSDRDPTLAFRCEAQIDSVHFVANPTSQLILSMLRSRTTSTESPLGTHLALL